MVAVVNRHSVKLNIGKISRKISDLEVQRKKLSENIGQLRQARDRLICKLRSIPSESKTNLVEEEASLDKTNSDKSTRTKFLLNSDQDIFFTRTREVTKNDASYNCDKVVDADKNDVKDEFWTVFATDLPYDDLGNGKAQDREVWENISLYEDKEEEINLTKNTEKSYITEDLTLKMKAPIKHMSNAISDVIHAFSNFQFKPSPPVIPADEKPAPPVFKAPDIPGVQRPVLKQRKPKSRQGKLFEIQHILGECKTTKPINSKADFDKAEYRILRPSGQKGTVARGRGLDEVKCVTKKALAYSETGWKRKGDQGEALFVVTGKHDEAEQAVEPVHLDGKAKFTPEGKVECEGQLYSQLSQTQCYI